MTEKKNAVERLQAGCVASTTDFVSVSKEDVWAVLRVATVACNYVDIARGGCPTEPLARLQYDDKLREAFSRLANNAAPLKARA